MRAYLYGVAFILLLIYLFPGKVQAGETETVAGTFLELKEALESADITMIYLSEDIVVESAVKINPDKPSLTIDGINPSDSEQKIHTLTEFNSSSKESAIALRSNGALKEITLRNMMINGKNHYGTICVYEEAKNVLNRYENIEYYGPQLTYNRYGSAYYKDTTAQIGKFGGASAPGEVGEVSAVTMEGRIRFTQVDAQLNEIFYIELQAGDIHVMEGADVEITALNESGFLYASNNVSLYIHQNASFQYQAPKRFWENNPLKGLSIEEHAKFRINITEVLQYNSILRVDGSLQVGENAIFELICAKNPTYPALVINGGDTVFNNPKRVLIYSPGARSIFYNTKTLLQFTGQQFNHWNKAGDGGFDDLPLHNWKKADGTDFVFSGTVGIGLSGNLLSVSSNYDVNDGAESDAPGISTFPLVELRVFAAGRMDVTASYRLSEDGRVIISGNTEPGAAVEIYSGDTMIGEPVTADDTGAFTMTVLQEDVEHGILTVKAAFSYLYAQEELTFYEAGLSFKTIPENITFVTTQLSVFPVLVPRRDDSWSVVIDDNLAAGSEWELLVCMETPLTPQDATLPVLENALVYIDENNKQHTIEREKNVVVYSTISAGDGNPVTITWKEEQGIRAYIEPGVAYTNTVYKAKLNWTLQNAP